MMAAFAEGNNKILIPFYVPGESKKCPTFEKIVLLEYHGNDVDNHLVLFPVRPIRLSNLPGFNRPFFPVEIGDFLQKAPFENLQIRVKHQGRFHFVPPPSNNDSWMCSFVLSSWENGIPLNE